jgi:hypothetical protein
MMSGSQLLDIAWICENIYWTKRSDPDSRYQYTSLYILHENFILLNLYYYCDQLIVQIVWQYFIIIIVCTETTFLNFY